VVTVEGFGEEVGELICGVSVLLSGDDVGRFVFDFVGIVVTCGVGIIVGGEGILDVEVGKGIVVGLAGTIVTEIGTMLGPSEVAFSGLNTASMTCRKPLHATKSAVRTPALSNITGLRVTETEAPLRRVVRLPTSRFVEGNEPGSM
jgi:hypothetical protein